MTQGYISLDNDTHTTTGADMEDPERLSTPDELAKHLGVCRATVYNQLLTKGVPSVKVGRSRRFRGMRVSGIRPRSGWQIHRTPGKNRGQRREGERGSMDISR